MRDDRQRTILEKSLLNLPVLDKLRRLKNWKFLPEFAIEVAKKLIQKDFPEPEVEVRHNPDPEDERAFRLWDTIRQKEEYVDQGFPDHLRWPLEEVQKTFWGDRSKEGRLIYYLLLDSPFQCATNVISVVRDMYGDSKGNGVSEEEKDLYIWMFEILARKYNHLTARDLFEEAQKE
jgi:hypothetical protein